MGCRGRRCQYEAPNWRRSPPGHCHRFRSTRKCACPGSAGWPEGLRVGGRNPRRVWTTPGTRVVIRGPGIPQSTRRVLDRQTAGITAQADDVRGCADEALEAHRDAPTLPEAARFLGWPLSNSWGSLTQAMTPKLAQLGDAEVTPRRAGDRAEAAASDESRRGTCVRAPTGCPLRRPTRRRWERFRDRGKWSIYCGKLGLRRQR